MISLLEVTKAPGLRADGAEQPEGLLHLTRTVTSHESEPGQPPGAPLSPAAAATTSRPRGDAAAGPGSVELRVSEVRLSAGT
jgi:hypothetical protein